MRPPRRVGFVRPGFVRVGVAALLLAAAVGCGGSSDPLSGPGATPDPREGRRAAVDVCDLLPLDVVTRELDMSLAVVGTHYTAARMPTFVCDFGERYADPLVSVELAAGPVALDVFDRAYGPPAGGDPQPLLRLAQGAYLRSEGRTRSLHIFAHGAVLSVTLFVEVEPPPRGALVALGTEMAKRIPGNPVLAPTIGGPPCTEISRATVRHGLGGVPPRVVSADRVGDSMTCSWAGLPGSVIVQVLATREELRTYRRRNAVDTWVEVPGISAGDGVRAWSRADRAGDLLLVDPDTAAVVTVVPAAGFASPTAASTPAERDLAAAVIAHLL